MEKKIIDMFNGITASDYYISNPYSSACNKAFKRLFQSSDFLKHFYLLSNKTYERLAMIANISEDSTKNTVFVTGFRGCGKSCFMNLLKSIVDSEYELPAYKACKNEEKEMIRRMSGDKQQDENEKLEKRYRKSSNVIKSTIQTQMESHGMEVVEHNYAQYINTVLKGKSVFLNFEKGNSSNDELPFDKKFILKIEEVIDEIIRNKGQESSNNIFARVINLYKQHTIVFDNTFEYRNTLLSFFEFCENSLLMSTSYSKEKRALNDVLNKLNLEQLIFLLVLLHLSLQLEKRNENEEISKMFFIMDNMDIVYRYNILNESMHEYSNFIENMNSLMEELEHTQNGIWSKMYENITFIFAMRETTAMQIADHFRDGMGVVAKHFDISMDIDKALVIEKKYYYIKQFEEQITNTSLKKTLTRIHNISTDFYIKSNVFPMFNNDYKRAIACITSICEHNDTLIEQEIELAKSGVDFNKNGARAIIFRVIFDEFMSKRYFDKIGIDTSKNHNRNFTISRPILTLLYNLLPEYDENGFDDGNMEHLTPETVTLRNLYFLCKPIMGKKLFINALIGMFTLKEVPTWNHLITFDNIKKVTQQELDKYLSEIDNDNLEQVDEIELRITCAGVNYIKFICTHFEFFACRYTRKTSPLFATKNEFFIEQEGKYRFEYVLNDVYEAVLACCNNLEQYNQKIIQYQESIGDVPLLESDYVYKSKEDNEGRLHEERIIHWHIRYIDNYRMHIIQDIYPDRVMDINKKIITYIEKYVKLLDNPLMSDMSRILNEELLACIGYIKAKEYNDNKTQISRSSYKLLAEGGLINEF